MGTRGEHKRVENLLGTVAADVVIHASCPVIVVPQYADRPEISRIAHALDLRRVNEEMLMQWSGLLGSPEGLIHLVYFGGADDHSVPGELQELQKSLQLHLPGSHIQTHKLHKHELVGDLSLFCDQHHIDLLIMYRGRNSWKRKLFHRSLTRQMAGKTKVPLLIL
jgi:nucleotide-binding universal stress UspA family protein